jgi:hypothetical protein
MVAASLILALQARVPFVGGLLLHDHSDDGVHSHTVTLDDMRAGDLCASWHRFHDDSHNDDRDNRSNDSDGSEYTDSLLIFVSTPATATGIHCSSGAMIASIQHLSSKVLPRSMLPSYSTSTSRFSRTPWPSTQPLRPFCALNALLQCSQALLL